jgi:hypothetical protein
MADYSGKGNHPISDEPHDRIHGVSKTGNFVKGHAHSVGRGRPMGSKHKLSEKFLKALSKDFAEHGVEAIQRCREDHLDVYIRSIVALIPKEFTLNVNPIESMDDAQLNARVSQLIAYLGAFGTAPVIDGACRVADGAEAPEGHAEAGIVSPVH